MNKKLYINKFKDKNITLMGLGVLGRGLQVTQFLAKNGARMTVTDLKNKDDLKTSLKKLKKYKINYVLGKHDLTNFKKADIVIKAAGVPLESPYIEEARKNKISVVMDASLFTKIVREIYPSVKIIGITGTRGKSMTTALIYHILKQNKKYLKAEIHLGGNMRAKATLPLLEKISPKDIVVLELDSWQCQGFGDEKISPDIAVFTNLMPDHMNYYKNDMKKYLSDKSNIFKYQNNNDILVTSKETRKILPKKITSKIVIADKNLVSDFAMNIFGEHNLINASYAYHVAKECRLSDIQIKKSIKSFQGLEGRLQYIAKIKGVNIINDNNSTTPEATVAGIKAIREKYKKSNIILIAGGANKKLETTDLVKNIEKNCKNLILLSGSGTENLKKMIRINYFEANKLVDAVSKSFECAKKNDVILFSPGFASFGLFKNEYDRNDKFINLIKKWK